MVLNSLQDQGLIKRVACDDYCVGACHDVVIAIWRKQTQPHGIAVLRDCIDERTTLHKRIGLLQVIEDDASAPDALARQALGKMHLEQAHLIYRSAVVYAKPGFAGMTARAIITGVAMLNPPKFEHVIFSNISSALQWLCAQTSRGKALNALEQAVATLRSAGSSREQVRELRRK